MLKTKTTLWLFLLSTIFLFVLMPIFADQLISLSKIFFWFILFVTLIWFFLFLILTISFGVLIKMAPKNHWYNSNFIGTFYRILTKEARAVANDYYQFNPSKGVAK